MKDGQFDFDAIDFAVNVRQWDPYVSVDFVGLAGKDVQSVLD